MASQGDKDVARKAYDSFRGDRLNKDSVDRFIQLHFPTPSEKQISDLKICRKQYEREIARKALQEAVFRCSIAMSNPDEDEDVNSNASNNLNPGGFLDLLGSSNPVLGPSGNPAGPSRVGAAAAGVVGQNFGGSSPGLVGNEPGRGKTTIPAASGNRRALNLGGGAGQNYGVATPVLGDSARVPNQIPLGGAQMGPPVGAFGAGGASGSALGGFILVPQNLGGMGLAGFGGNGGALGGQGSAAVNLAGGGFNLVPQNLGGMGLAGFGGNGGAFGGQGSTAVNLAGAVPQNYGAVPQNAGNPFVADLTGAGNQLIGDGNSGLGALLGGDANMQASD